MPIYEYECRNHHRFDVKQSFSDKPKAECPTCEAPAKRVLNVPAVIYKGSGFYTTDYGKKRTGSGSGDGPTKSDSSAKSGDASGDSASSGPSSDSKSKSKNGDSKSSSSSSSSSD